ncbi:MAG TPA: PilZ domain-containing protein [Planctomycetota bacterium]|nr:PilZ domain-containing protein [Planctomycetota bacterium]
MQTERRRHPRVKPDSMFRVQAYNPDFAENPLHRTNLALRCLDLSARGACIVTPGRLRVGCPLILSIDIPDTATRFRGKAVIRWSQSVEKQGREAHVAGMEILEVQECQGERVGFLSGAQRNLLPADTRQKHRRVLANEAEVTCTVAGFMGALGLSGNIAKSLVDLSEGGCKLVLEKKVEAGAKVKLQFSFKHPALKISTEGIVKRCDRDTLRLEPKYDTGIEFQNMPNGDAANLRIVLKALSE